MTRREAKIIVNDLIEHVYNNSRPSKKWEVQFGRNPWFSIGLHIDHHDPSITFHLPGVLIYVGNCEQPGFKFWNKIVPDTIQKGGSDES